MAPTNDIQNVSRRRSAIQQVARPDMWAQTLNLRVDGSPFSTEGREYVIQVMRDNSERIVVKKAAQMAFTILCLIRSFHWVIERKWHHLYLMPKKEGLKPFVQSRVDTIIDSNPKLKGIFSSVDNVLHKQTIDDVKFLFRGTNIESELHEVPVDVEVWDERDRMNTELLPIARRRMDASNIKRLTQISTPSIEGYGIDAEDVWGDSDQHEWEVACPHCSRYQVIVFPDNFNLGENQFDSSIFCVHCKKEWTDQDRAAMNVTGRWVPQHLTGNQRGYHISQFNSPDQSLADALEDWYAGQKDARVLKTFFTHTLGLSYTAPGDKFTETLLDNSRVDGHRLGGIPSGPVYVGIDQGDFFHVTASYLKGQKRIKWLMAIFREWSEIDDFLSGLGSFNCVIDSEPERKAARDLSVKYNGRVWLAFTKDRNETASIAEWGKVKWGEASKVNVDKPMAMDTVIGSYMKGNTVLPFDARDIGEEMPNKPYQGFYHQMLQLVRIEEEDTKGIVRGRWVKNKNKDHWHHADMFEMIATMHDPVLVVPAKISNAFKGKSLITA